MFSFGKQSRCSYFFTLLLAVTVTSTVLADATTDIAALPSSPPSNLAGLMSMWGSIKNIANNNTTLNTTDQNNLWEKLVIGTQFDFSNYTDASLYQLMAETLRIIATKKLINDEMQGLITSFLENDVFQPAPSDSATPEQEGASTSPSKKAATPKKPTAKSGRRPVTRLGYKTITKAKRR
jgi:hypothetical protein